MLNKSARKQNSKRVSGTIYKTPAGIQMNGFHNVFLQAINFKIK